MKVLICPNLSGGPFSHGETLTWLKEMASVCLWSNGAIEACIAIENGHQHLVKRTELNFRYFSYHSIDKSALAKIRKNEFYFDALFIKGRNHQIEQAARQLGLFHLSFGKAPWPLDTWVIESAWPHRYTNRVEAAAPVGPSVTDAGTFGILPLLENEYGRYAPYIGRIANFIYSPDMTCVLVPLYYYYKKTIGEDGLCRIMHHIKALADKHRNLFFLVTPMSFRADRLKSVFSRSGPQIVWLNRPDGRWQILSLTAKSNAVLALDTTSALLPLFMDKPVCCDIDSGDGLIEDLPKLGDWLNSKFSAAQMSMIGEQLSQRALSYHIVPKHYGPLLRYQKFVSNGDSILINDPAFWNECRNFEQESLEMRQPASPAVVRKLRKLRKDPYAFCNDSTNPLIRNLRVVFKALGPVRSVRSV